MDASPASTVRYGIIGTGMMGHEHARNLALVPGAKVVAYSDPSPEQRWWTAQLVGDGPRAYADHRDLLADDAVDAVVVASPNHTHAAVLADVFASGKAVLCEKPLCTTVPDAERVAERAEASSALFWVGMEYRYMAPIARLVAEVRAGTIGALKMVAIREHRFPFLPKVGDWNRFNRNTGGTFVEKCCHFFDLMRLIAASEPVRVFASAGMDVNHLDEVYDGEKPDILDNGFVTVEFASGARGLLDLCMFAEATRNEQEIAATGDAGKVECFLPESTLVVGRRQPREVRTEKVAVDAQVLAAGAHHGSTFAEHVAFRQAMLSGGPPEVSARDGLMAVACGVAAERSAREGRPVRIDELLRPRA